MFQLQEAAGHFASEKTSLNIIFPRIKINHKYEIFALNIQFTKLQIQQW